MDAQTIFEKTGSIDRRIEFLEDSICKAEERGDKEKAHEEKIALIAERTQLWALLAQLKQQGMVIIFVL
jgi:hypothetical protein